MAKDKRRMQQNRAKKKARIAARKKTRKQQRARFINQALAELGCSRGAIWRAPLYGAWIGAALAETGIGHVIIARKLEDGRVAAGFFLTDPYCLGAKDAFLTVKPESEFTERLVSLGYSQPLRQVSPACARKLVEGAVAYARDLGFEPHADYDDAVTVYGDIDPAECPEIFTYGKDGKPYFVNGPHISTAKARAYVEHLTRRCGPDGFNYLIGTDDLNDDWIDDDRANIFESDGEDEDLEFEDEDDLEAEEEPEPR